MHTLNFEDWGLIAYDQALDRQLQLVETVQSEQTLGTLVFCTHPAIVTLGRKSEPSDIFGWKGPIKEISRGGRATYHGPSQLVVYPILNLEKVTEHRPARDIGKYLRLLEEAIVVALAEFGVSSQGRSLQQKDQSEVAQEETGVWVGRQKIASLGIGVKKWVTYHGAAINLENDPTAFQGMRPCGFDSKVMVSLEELLSEKVDRIRFQKTLKTELLRRLS